MPFAHIYTNPALNAILVWYRDQVWHANAHTANLLDELRDRVAAVVSTESVESLMDDIYHLA